MLPYIFIKLLENAIQCILTLPQRTFINILAVKQQQNICFWFFFQKAQTKIQFDIYIQILCLLLEKKTERSFLSKTRI